MKRLLTAIIVMAMIVGAASAAEKDEAPKQVLITNVNVWDGIHDEVRTGVDVLVEDNKIKTFAAGIEAPNANVVDGKGGTMTPGLMDLHQHLNGGLTIGTTDKDAYVQGAHASRGAQYLLMLGFTTVRDIGGNTTGLKKEIMAGRLPGPRLYTSGAALGRRVYGFRNSEHP